MSTRYTPEFETLPEPLKAVLRQTRGAGGHCEEDVSVPAKPIVPPTSLIDSIREGVDRTLYPNYGSAEMGEEPGAGTGGSDLYLK